MKNIKNTLIKWLPVIVLTLAGGIIGYLYYYFVGCVSGSCAITSNPIKSTLYCAVIGALVGMIVMPSKKKRNKEVEKTSEET